MKDFNTHKFITISTLTMVAICSTNCGKIKTYRGDPSTWGNSNPVKKSKTVKKTKVKSDKKGGLAGFFAGLRGKKTATAETQSSAVAATPTPRVASNPASNQPSPRRLTQRNPVSPRVVEPSVPSRSTSTASQKRRIIGMRAPEVGNIPSKKDLEEVESPRVKPSTEPGITVPTKP